MRKAIPRYFIEGGFMQVRIREDNGKYLAYFIDIKKLVGVNEVGARIIDLFFNQLADIDSIILQIADEYGAPIKDVSGDTEIFLRQVRVEISPETYSDVVQEQLLRPLGVELEITKSCNLRCRHCFQKFHPEGEMSLEKIVSIIDTINANDVFEVAIIGGEPMRHSNIMEILTACEERNLAYSMVTNGTLINSESIKVFQKLPRLSVMVSLEGVGSVHEAIRGKGTFKKVDKTLHGLSDAGVEVETLCTLNAENLSRFREVADYCREIGIACNFNLFKPFWPEQHSLIPDPQEFFAVVIELLKMRQHEGYNVGLSNAAIIGDLLGMAPRNECRATRSGFAINVHGQMVTCPLLETAGHYKAGELPMFDDNFIETWQTHPAFNAFRKGGFRECQARALIFSGDVNGNDPYGVLAFNNFRMQSVRD